MEEERRAGLNSCIEIKKKKAIHGDALQPKEAKEGRGEETSMKESLIMRRTIGSSDTEWHLSLC